MQAVNQSNTNIKKYAILAALIGMAVLAYIFFRDYLSFEALRDNRAFLIEFRNMNYVLTVVAFVTIYAVVAGFSLPGALALTLAGGFLFSTFPGVIYNVVGATIGATLLFLAARWGLGDQLAAKLENSDGLSKKIKDGIDENQWSMLFLIRLVPAVPFFVANLVPAFLDVPLRRFFISTFFGILPGSLVYTSVGAGLGDVFERGETPNLSIFWEPQIILPILGLCALSALPIVLKLIRGKKGL